MIEEVTQLINIIACTVFHQTTKGEKFYVNVKNVIAIKKANENETLTNQKESQQSSSFTLNKEQYNCLLALLQQAQLAATPSNEHHHISNTSTGIICNLRSLPKSVLWILDSGVSDHISSSLDKFATYKIISDVPIKLPNGTTVYANIKGTIIFSTTFILHNVLYIPGFNFNLISVSHLAIKFDCSIRFTDQICEIQDNHTKRMIGFAKMHHGFYVLENPKGPKKNTLP